MNRYIVIKNQGLKAILNLFHHLGYPLVIVFLTFFVWHPVCFQSLMGEGFFYFNENQSFFGPNGELNGLWLSGRLRYDSWARLMYWLMAKVFGDQIPAYMLTMLIILALVHLVFYRLVKKMTKKPLLAFLATVILVPSFTAFFETLAIGNYQFFAQRIPNFIPAFFSLIFLLKFLEKPKGIDYLFSFLLWSLALMMAHFSLIFLPFFLWYLFWDGLEKRKISHLWLALPFVLITLFILSRSMVPWEKGAEGALKSALTANHWQGLQKTLFQLVVLSFPSGSLKWLAQLLRFNLKQLIFSLIGPVVLIYLGLTTWLLKREKDLQKTTLTSLFFLFSSLAFNAYWANFDPFGAIEGSRYFYLPFLGFSLFFGIFLFSFLKKRQGVLFFFLVLWIGYNTFLVWNRIHKDQPFHLAHKKILSYFKENLPQLPEGAVVVVPRVGYYGVDFIKKFYATKPMKFYTLEFEWNKDLAQSLAQKEVFVFDYDEASQKVVLRSR